MLGLSLLRCFVCTKHCLLLLPLPLSCTLQARVVKRHVAETLTGHANNARLTLPCLPSHMLLLPLQHQSFHFSIPFVLHCLPLSPLLLPLPLLLLQMAQARVVERHDPETLTDRPETATDEAARLEIPCLP